MILFQARAKNNSRKLFQTDSEKDIISFIQSRNPEQMEIFGLHPFTMEIRWIIGARKFLTEITKTAEGENGTAGSV